MSPLTRMLERRRELDRWKLARWAEREPALAGLEPNTLIELLVDDRPPIDHQHKDEILRALLRLARCDGAAGEYVMACLVPGIRRLVTRHSRGAERGEVEAELVAALWRRIRRYPIERRPNRIAANLLLDALHDVTHAPAATRARVGEETIDNSEYAGTPAPADGWSAATIFADARRAGVLDNIEVELIESTRLAADELRAVATRLGLAYDAACKRRRRAEKRFVEWWAPEHRGHRPRQPRRTDEPTAHDNPGTTPEGGA